VKKILRGAAAELPAGAPPGGKNLMEMRGMCALFDSRKQKSERFLPHFLPPRGRRPRALITDERR